MPNITFNNIVFSGGITLQAEPPPPATEEQLYTTPGTYTWTVPAGATSICVVCVGGGGGGGGNGSSSMRGGGGGGLSYKNNIAVLVGNTYTVTVGAGGIGSGQDLQKQYRGGNGGDGAVRIIWGSGRSFPNNAA